MKKILKDLSRKEKLLIIIIFILVILLLVITFKNIHNNCCKNISTNVIDNKDEKKEIKNKNEEENTNITNEEKPELKDEKIKKENTVDNTNNLSTNNKSNSNNNNSSNQNNVNNTSNSNNVTHPVTDNNNSQTQEPPKIVHTILPLENAQTFEPHPGSICSAYVSSAKIINYDEIYFCYDVTNVQNCRDVFVQLKITGADNKFINYEGSAGDQWVPGETTGYCIPYLDISTILSKDKSTQVKIEITDVTWYSLYR